MTIDWEGLISHTMHDVLALTRQGVSNVQLLRREEAGNLSPSAVARLETVAASQQKIVQLLGQLGRLRDAIRADKKTLWSDVQDLDVVVLGAKLEQKSVLSEAAAELAAEGLPQAKIPAKLQFVFSELLRNAAQFRDPERPLRIEIEGSCQEPGWVQVRTTDNGLGWDHAYTHKLFQPFERVRAGKGGAGLGLATCRVLVETAGGRIHAEPGVSGATFTIDLPTAEPN
jgi:signal transduction histidine kinase